MSGYNPDWVLICGVLHVVDQAKVCHHYWLDHLNFYPKVTKELNLFGWEVICYTPFSHREAWITAHPSCVLEPFRLDESFVARLDANERDRTHQVLLNFSDHKLPSERVNALLPGFSLVSISSPPTLNPNPTPTSTPDIAQKPPKDLKVSCYTPDFVFICGVLHVLDPNKTCRHYWLSDVSFYPEVTKELTRRGCGVFCYTPFSSSDRWIAAHPSCVLDPTILDASFLAELDAKEIRRKQLAPLLFSDHPLPPELVAFLVKSWMGFSQHALHNLLSLPPLHYICLCQEHIYMLSRPAS